MHKLSSNQQIENLNEIAAFVASGDERMFGALSTGEKCYVALASNRGDLLERMDYTIAEAIARIGQDWTTHLIYCWQYAGNPKRA